MNRSISEYFDGQESEIPQIVDLRELEAPGPMETILMACAQLKPDEKYLAQLPHVPNPLFPHLETRGMQWQVFEQADGSALLLIWSRD